MLLISLLQLPQRVAAADLDSRAGAVTTGSGRLNVRSSASASSGVVASLPKGSYVTLISRSGAWWRVEYGDNRFGYCHADYITPVVGTPATVSTRSGSLNVRKGPGTGYAKVTALPKGEVVILLSESSGWSRILYNGTKTGYVSSSYLASSGDTYPAVSLAVPNYKQNDSRWASVKIGTSGKTIAQIGCATTAIAMLESYRTGKVIYPDTMSRQLRYTSSGDLFWPEHYTPVTDSTDYLWGIYERLKQGKPVLFGGKNRYGGQHWVVITGFTGGDSLQASSFTIHDPGTHSRTTLQHFLSVYPNFYKYFYY